tara:strand:+ start:506 stop:967 length:462 start_codon:yes stop_codon:yes gene_type:complete
MDNPPTREEYEIALVDILTEEYSDNPDIDDILNSCLRMYDRCLSNECQILSPEDMIDEIVQTRKNNIHQINLMRSLGLNSDDMLDKMFPKLLETFEQKEEITGQDTIDFTKDMANDFLTDGTAHNFLEKMFNSGTVNNLLENMFGNNTDQEDK